MRATVIFLPPTLRHADIGTGRSKCFARHLCKARVLTWASRRRKVVTERQSGASIRKASHTVELCNSKLHRVASILMDGPRLS